MSLGLTHAQTPAEDAARAPAPPIEIEANFSDYDLRTGVSEFRDHIVIRRGTMLVNADLGWVHQSEGRISRVELEGNPSTWSEVLEDGTELQGEALRIEFDVPANLVTLTGNARIRHAQGEFTGDELIYDLTAESLAGRSTGDGKVRVVIEPEALSKDN